MTKIASFTAEQNAEQEARSGKVMPYTPAPWKVRKLIHGSWDQWDITAEIAGMRIAIAATPGGNGNDSSNARRIVACVNACEGMLTENLEGTSMDKIYRSLREERDELAEALRDMVHYDDLPVPEQAPAMAKARAVLAKVRP